MGRSLRLWGPEDEGSGRLDSWRMLGPRDSHQAGSEVGGALAAMRKGGQTAAGRMALGAEELGAVQPQAGVKHPTGVRPGSCFPLHCPPAWKGC